jgi:hypothetical protein
MTNDNLVYDLLIRKIFLRFIDSQNFFTIYLFTLFEVSKLAEHEVYVQQSIYFWDSVVIDQSLKRGTLLGLSLI